MRSLQPRVEAIQRSGLGLFVRKVIDDKITDLAALLAWGTLSTILPLLLGILGVAGLVLRDPSRLDEAYNTLLAVIPGEAAGLLGGALEGVRSGAGPLGTIAVVLVLFNGSSFFANMGSVFDQAYHVK